MAVQWLRLCLIKQGIRVQSLVKEVRFPTCLVGKKQNKTKQKQYYNRFNKDLKHGSQPKKS